MVLHLVAKFFGDPTIIAPLIAAILILVIVIIAISTTGKWHSDNKPMMAFIIFGVLLTPVTIYMVSRWMLCTQIPKTARKCTEHKSKRAGTKAIGSKLFGTLSSVLG